MWRRGRFLVSGLVLGSSGPGARFSKLDFRQCSVKDGSFKHFENGAVKLLAKETKWTSVEVRTHPTFLETLISKYDFGPVRLPGLSRNRSPGSSPDQEHCHPGVVFLGRDT